MHREDGRTRADPVGGRRCEPRDAGGEYRRACGRTRHIEELRNQVSRTASAAETLVSDRAMSKGESNDDHLERAFRDRSARLSELSRGETATPATSSVGAAEGKRLGVLAPAGSRTLESFSGASSERGEKTLLVCPLTHGNALAPARRAAVADVRLRWHCARQLAAATGWAWRRRAIFGRPGLSEAGSG